MSGSLYEAMWGAVGGPHQMQVTAENLDEVAAWLGGGSKVADDRSGIDWKYVGAPFCTYYETRVPIGWWIIRRDDGGHYARESPRVDVDVTEWRHGLRALGQVADGVTYWRVEPGPDGKTIATQVDPSEIRASS